MKTRILYALLGVAILESTIVATPVHAERSLLNLTQEGASIAAGNQRCPNQQAFLYVGGRPDSFSMPSEPAYPSVNLFQYMTVVSPSPGGVVDYDDPVINGRVGDSFNLQNTRSVCHALIQYRARYSMGADRPDNDGLTIGHVGNGGSPFSVIAQVIDPGAAPYHQTHAFTSAGLALLSNLTGVNLNRTPLDSILDIFLQDDTKIDFIRLWIWYGNNVQDGPNDNPCCSPQTPNQCTC